jgi:hypothetical protein
MQQKWGQLRVLWLLNPSKSASWQSMLATAVCGSGLIALIKTHGFPREAHFCTATWRSLYREDSLTCPSGWSPMHGSYGGTRRSSLVVLFIGIGVHRDGGSKYSEDVRIFLNLPSTISSPPSTMPTIYRCVSCCLGLASGHEDAGAKQAHRTVSRQSPHVPPVPRSICCGDGGAADCESLCRWRSSSLGGVLLWLRTLGGGLVYLAGHSQWIAPTTAVLIRASMDRPLPSCARHRVPRSSVVVETRCNQHASAAASRWHGRHANLIPH